VLSSVNCGAYNLSIRSALLSRRERSVVGPRAAARPYAGGRCHLAGAADPRLVRQILGAVAQFEKAALVAKLRAARNRVRAERGRCEGRKPVPVETLAAARRLARKSPKTGKRRSLRAISAELAVLGHFGPTGKPYLPGSVARMLG
jgi:hypothetical protein